MALVGYVYLCKAGITWIWWVVGLAEVFGRLAQLVEQLTLNQRVKGSSPLSPSNFNDLAGVVKSCTVFYKKLYTFVPN